MMHSNRTADEVNIMAKKEGKKTPTKTKRVKKSDYYAVNDGKLERKKKSCLKCGNGVFMGDHKDRYACGKCGFTVFKK